MEVRPAEESELDRLIEIHTTAFPDPRAYDLRRTNFVANPLGPFSALHVAHDRGTIAGHAFLFDLDVWIGGARVKCGAIASVGVAAEHRGQGVATALVEHLHERARANGAAFTMLYPFRQSFYARHGYAPVTPTRRWTVHPASIPKAWRDEPGVTLRRAHGDSDRIAIEASYDRAASRTTGWLARPKALWDRKLAGEWRTWIVAERSGAIAGHVAWTVDQRVPHGATRLVVDELCADDDAAKRALLGAVGAMRDQIAEVVIETDARDPLPHALIDPDRARFGDAEVEHALGTIAGGPMVRMTTLELAIAARTIAHDAPFALDVDGTKLTFGAGGDAHAVAIDRATLGAVLFGGLSMTSAHTLGMARGDATAIARAHAAFVTPPFFALDMF